MPLDLPRQHFSLYTLETYSNVWDQMYKTHKINDLTIHLQLQLQYTIVVNNLFFQEYKSTMLCILTMIISMHYYGPQSAPIHIVLDSCTEGSTSHLCKQLCTLVFLRHAKFTVSAHHRILYILTDTVLWCCEGPSHSHSDISTNCRHSVVVHS